jgi:membrane-bound serine protease (ClpP class)
MEEFLLNPNVAYVALVSGFLLAILALLSPGTGLVEVGGLILMIIAGWGIYNLPVNLWALVILLLGVFPIILAVRRSGNMIYLLVSIAALVIGSVFLFQGEGWRPAVDPVLAVVTSGLVGGFFWVVVRSVVEAEYAPHAHDLQALVGRTGEAKTEIKDEGTVQVAGELWTAQSDRRIPEGTAVRVISRQGFILQVEPKEELPEEESQAAETPNEEPQAKETQEVEPQKRDS